MMSMAKIIIILILSMVLSPEAYAGSGRKVLNNELKNYNEATEFRQDLPGLYNFSSPASKDIQAVAKTKEIEEVLKREIDLDTLINAAYVRNPGLEAARLKWLAAFEKYDQATRLDNILRQYQSFVKDINTLTGSMKHKSFIKNRFPLPGTVTLKGDIVATEVRMAKEKYLIALKNLIYGITVNYDELLFVIEEINITGENLSLLTDLEYTASIKYSTGTAGFNDVVKAQIEISKLATDFEILKEKKVKVAAKIKEYVNISPELKLGHPKARDIREFTISLAELYGVGEKNQQEIRLLSLQIKKANLAITLAEKKFYPDLTMGLSYFENDSASLVGMGSKKEAFPLRPTGKTDFWFGANDAYVREARIMYQSLNKKLDEARNRLFFDVRDAFFHIDKSKKDIHLYANSMHIGRKTSLDIAALEPESLLAQTKKSIDISKIEYESGKLDFLNVLDAQKRFLEFSINYILAVKVYKQSLVRMEKIVGVSLTNWKLN